MIFGVRTVKLDDAEYAPRLMASSLGLRIWQTEEEFYLVGRYKLEDQPDEIAKAGGDGEL